MATEQTLQFVIWRWSVKVGDLVRLKQHCKNGGALAIVVGVPEYKGYKEVKITFLNPTEKSSSTEGLQRSARTSNLTLVNES